MPELINENRGSKTTDTEINHILTANIVTKQ